MNEEKGGLRLSLEFAKSVPRMTRVADTLRRHGFGDILLGRGPWPPPESVRAALEDLGPVFVKLGQVLSTRRDLLPEEYIEALEQLQDQTSPLELDAVREVVESELGAPPEEVFAHFEPEPIASASIAQVHGATTMEGVDVVVKVQRPGLHERVVEDLMVLAQLAGLVDLAAPSLRPFNPPALVRDFREGLERELDFRGEAENMRRIRAGLGGATDVWIPPVVDELSTRRVLTMHRSHGIRMDRYVEAKPDEAPGLARRLGRLFIRQVFGDGLFHADPHPGNFFVMPDGVLCLHDFGMVGEIDERTREALVSLVEATVAGDARLATSAYLDLGLVPPDVDRHAVEREVARVVLEVRSQSLQDVSVGRALGVIVRLGGRYRIRQPGSIMLLSRAFVTLEGVLARLDPDLSFLDVFGEAYKESAVQRVTPERLRRDALQAFRAVDRLVREAPEDVRGTLRRWADGSLGRVVISSDREERERHDRDGRAMRRVAAGGLLAITGSVLTVGSAGWLAVAGGIAVALGALVLLVHVVRP